MRLQPGFGSLLGQKFPVTPSLFPPPGSQSLALIPPFSEFCYRVPRVHTGLLSLGEAGGSSRQLGDRPCFLRKTRRRQRICWVFFPQFATRMCCLSFAFWKMLGLLGELLWWGCSGDTRVPPQHLSGQLLQVFLELWSRGIVRFGRDFKAHLVPHPRHGQGHLSLDQVAWL